MRKEMLKLAFILLGLFSCSLMAVERSEINLTSIPKLDDDLNLNVQLYVDNRSTFPIKDVRIFYRELSENEFHSKYLRPQGFRYLAAVDLSKFAGSVVEYYFGIAYLDGADQAYPPEAPAHNLYEIAVQDEGEQTSPGIEIISPEPDESIYTDEFIFTVSYLPYSANVDKERTKLYLDTWDVSQYLNMFDDFLTFAPNKVPPGRHTMRLELYDRSGNLIATESIRFTALARRGPTQVSTGLRFSGNGFAESRYEELSDGQQIEHYVNAGFRFNANAQQYSFGGRAYWSNQQNERTQYINRFTGWFQYDFWNNRYFRATGGDAYPQLHPYLLQNVFVRGFEGQLFLKFINLDFVMGKTRRAVEGRQNIGFNTITQVNDTTIVSGTFDRKVWGARTSFGGGEKFQFGLNAVKGRDDPQSIEYGKNPEENLGIGSDLFLAFDNNRVIVDGAIAASSYNPNILDGEDISFDSLQNADIDIDKNLYDFAKSLITINQYIVPIPALAYHAQLRLNYYYNNFSFKYNAVEGNYHSLGQPFLLRDNRGFTIADNIRLFQNQVFLNLRYMSYENNLNNIKPATTDNQTIGVSISYFPLRNFPSVTLGFNNYTRDNGYTEPTLKVPTPEDNSTNTINFSTSYTFWLNELNNQLTVNLMNYNREDNTTFNIDNLSNTLSILLQTKYQIPLKTNLEFSLQQTDNTIPNNESNLTINTFGAGGEYLFRDLFAAADQFSIGTFIRYGMISSDTQIPTGTMTVDYNRMFLNGRILYHIPGGGRISLNGDLMNYSGDKAYSDYIITTRYDINL